MGFHKSISTSAACVHKRATLLIGGIFYYHATLRPGRRSPRFAEILPVESHHPGPRFRGVGPHEPTGPATPPLETVGSPGGAPPTRRTVGKRSGNPSPDRADLTRDPPRVLLPIPVVGPPLRLPLNLVRSNRRGDGGGLRRPSVLHVRIVECPGRSGVCVPRGRRSDGETERQQTVTSSSRY